MRQIFFTTILFSCLVLPANANENHIFYTASAEGLRTVNLNLVSSGVASDGDFDVDVVISVVEKDSTGNSLYIDWSRHSASIRCNAPALVKVSETNYNINSALSAGIDWKHDLWLAVCMSPMS
ncbi:hypothetical protein IMCC20628_04790 (plasmid) [Hoeflea sp. IMCC20628]|uniref:hypothetical protein n=1 Tax=Hoeflea sp. IMCC20628 TaxID=1620421 RepID=UPI00063AD77A|nr:hypothetical protein [Hoeflea sp. IMCC20628]AKI03456.1 hypothetical protein IMCC20628_04790 [Hoeflea sp. IMCC20628]